MTHYIRRRKPKPAVPEFEQLRDLRSGGGSHPHTAPHLQRTGRSGGARGGGSHKNHIFFKTYSSTQESRASQVCFQRDGRVVVSENDTGEELKERNLRHTSS